MFISFLRRQIGTIISAFGFIILCILTFGDIYEILTEEYWWNVWRNITSIGIMSISLTTVQVTIKQGLAEQALQRGLNTEDTRKKYEEHKGIITANVSRLIYMPYFLQTYNRRQTEIKRREFLISNGFKSEEELMMSGRPKQKRLYKKINIQLTLASIKWATTDIIYNKNGQIETLAQYRRRRLIRGIIISAIFMFATTLIARGLFFSADTETISQKFVRLLTYVATLIFTSLMNVIKGYEKGAFGVPNELSEINEIWHEFENWQVPEWVEKDIKESMKEVIPNDKRGDLQEKQTTCKESSEVEADFENCSESVGNCILDYSSEELARQCSGDSTEVRQETIYRDSVGGQLSIFDSEMG